MLDITVLNAHLSDSGAKKMVDCTCTSEQDFDLSRFVLKYWAYS